MSDRSNLVTLGRRLQHLRKARGLTQQKLAELSELTPNYIGLIERGGRVVSVLKLYDLAEALDVPMSELFVE